MRVTDLKTGMIVRTQNGRFGFVEVEKNRIVFCYDPSHFDDGDANFECISISPKKDSTSACFNFMDDGIAVGYRTDPLFDTDTVEHTEFGDYVMLYCISEVFEMNKIDFDSNSKIINRKPVECYFEDIWFHGKVENDSIF